MMKQPKYLISACLCGNRCRYDGGGYDEYPALRRLAETGEALPFCPERAGGLPTPRVPCEIVGDEVISRTGINQTEAYQRGAEEALNLCRKHHIVCAILKENSPSCGVHHINDGTFTKTRIDGQGITAALLQKNGIKLYTETNPPSLKK